nr:MAG TPA_asm: minor structural protein [Caudoviricetes sp.]
MKEGTWSDSNYLTDNAYYFGALDVSADGAIPKINYNISVIDLAPLSEEYEDIYNFDLADVTYVEDIGMFGYDKHTGLPNRLKVLCSSISEGLDDPSKDTIGVQNFTTSFQDLFQQVTASVQSLTYNENIYKRSSNFTSLQNITTSSLQGALDTNDLTLLDTQENNI